MKKYLTFAALILSAVLALSGCYPTGEPSLPSDIQNTASEIQNFVGKVSEKFGDAEFNYEISPDLPTQMPKIKLKSKQLDDELVKNVMLRDKTVNPDADRPDWVIETTDGSLLQFSYGFTYYDGGVDDNRSNFLTIAGTYNEFCLSSSEQLKSFSSQEAIERVNKILDELGIENYGEPCVIPISPETGNAQLKKYGVYTTNKDQSRDDYDLWTEDDGIYILKYRFNINGTDICSGNVKTLETARTIPGADITAYVKKDLIFFLEINSWYDAVSLDEGTVDFKFSAGYASNALIEHYSKISTIKFPIFFTECKLEYIPLEYTDANEITYTPAWCFMGYENRGFSGDYRSVDFAEYYYPEMGIRYMGL